MSTPPVPPAPPSTLPTPTPTVTPIETLAAPPPSVAPPSPSPFEALTKTETDWAASVARAQAEYALLKPEAQSRLHTLLNDLETLYEVSLGGLHGLFHTGNPAPPAATPTEQTQK